MVAGGGSRREVDGNRREVKGARKEMEEARREVEGARTGLLFWQPCKRRLQAQFTSCRQT